MVRNVNEIEKEITQLSKEQLKQFRAWYEKFDSDEWDKQIEYDINNGKLDSIADAAITDYKDGKSTKL